MFLKCISCWYEEGLKSSLHVIRSMGIGMENIIKGQIFQMALIINILQVFFSIFFFLNVTLGLFFQNCIFSPLKCFKWLKCIYIFLWTNLKHRVGIRNYWTNVILEQFYNKKVLTVPICNEDTSFHVYRICFIKYFYLTKY